ncbi:MAG: glycoside hydrolase family 5 protein [Ruminococcus sp.]|nr:glycoside hydrolase family 5 protein [Ruminococcus sp.]
MRTNDRLAALLAGIVMLFCGAGCSSGDSSAAEAASSGEATSSTAAEAPSEEAEDFGSMTTAEIVADMKLGWNLGNSLDVCNADRNGDGQIDENAETVDETLWGNVLTTKGIFEKLKEDGFNAVRIPVTWRDHMDEDYNVDAAWMDRVQEVVDYAYDLDMYVILNVHHDGGGDPQFGAWIRNASRDYEGTLEKYKALWSQIAERFAGYGERLIFESMNEVGFDDLDETSAFDTLNKLNQEFVDLVRGSGGNNDKRHLLIAGYWTDIEKTCSSKYKMPEDPADSLILSVHYYTPWEFCTTTINRTWGTDSELKQMQRLISKLSRTYCEKGVPVIIGEFGTGVWNETASGVYFSENLVKLCREAGIAAFMWDDGGQFDRFSYDWRYPELVEAFDRAVNGGDYEVVKEGDSAS